MESLTYNDLPVAISGLIDQMNRIEALLLEARPDPELDMMTIQEVSAMLGIKTGTILNKACAREIPYFKQGKSLRFSRKDLNAWIVSGRKLTSQEQLTEYKSKTKSK